MTRPDYCPVAQEPCQCMCVLSDVRCKIRDTHPQPKREWVGLTDDERDAIFELYHTRLGGWDYGGDEVMYDKHFEDAVAAIEAKLKEKNT